MPCASRCWRQNGLLPFAPQIHSIQLQPCTLIPIMTHHRHSQMLSQIPLSSVACPRGFGASGWRSKLSCSPMSSCLVFLVGMACCWLDLFLSVYVRIVVLLCLSSSEIHCRLIKVKKNGISRFFTWRRDTGILINLVPWQSKSRSCFLCSLSDG